MDIPRMANMFLSVCKGNASTDRRLKEKMVKFVATPTFTETVMKASELVLRKQQKLSVRTSNVLSTLGRSKHCL